MARWVYPPLEEATTSMGLEEVDTYAPRRQNTSAQYIATWSILEICLVTEQRPGVQVMMRWWDQAGLNLGQEETDKNTEEEGEKEDNVKRATDEREKTVDYEGVGTGTGKLRIHST